MSAADLVSSDEQMIAIRHVFLGTVACAVVMIPFYIALWLVDIGGLGGMMDDDSYPMSIFTLPLIAAIFSGVAFWLGVFPCAHLAKWIANRKRLTITRGGSIAVCRSAAFGALFGIVAGGLYPALTYAAFLGSSSLAFWCVSAKTEVEQGRGANASSRVAHD